jgi:uncharacterized protein (TIGR03382 family)
MLTLTRKSLPLIALLAAGGSLAAPRAARACGCFAQPNAVQQVVQAGERIVFAVRGDEVEMHVQVAYSGDAQDFGWLLPVPEVPELSLGSDDLFAQLDLSFAPRFFFRRQLTNDCSFGNRDSAGGNGGNGSNGSNGANGGVVVSRQDIGAFDAVILDAADADAMFNWLATNEFMVPVGPEDDVVQRYIGEGRYFVALKLQANRDVGDIQPIVLTFPGSAAMIPITLTQVGATPDMPVIVHVFGDNRAIPRNYKHTVLNEEHIDWFNFGANYVDVVTQAVDEAEGAHSFVTEAAEAPNGLDFTFMAELPLASVRAAANTGELMETLRNWFFMSPKLQLLLRRFVEYPEQAENEGISEDEFYGDLYDYATTFDRFGELPVDAAATADAIEAEIVEPAVRAQALVDDFSVVTRLFTTLSPDEMTLDPVFDFSPLLPLKDNDLVATFEPVCNPDGEGFSSSGWLTLPDGRRFFTSASSWRDRVEENATPFSRQIQALYVEDAPVDLVDNSGAISPSDPPSADPNVSDGGCQSTPAPSLTGLVVALGLGAVLRRRRLRPERR